MRADMHEVLIERPRHGWRRKTARDNKPRVAEWDGDDGFDRAYAPPRHRTKYFNDLLSPLKRWLRSQVGRPWDKVWSELCSGMDTRTVTGRHLMDHARQFVSTNCRADADRKVWTLDRHWGRNGWEPVEGLYVDPRTGLLRWREPPPRRRFRRMSAPSDDLVVAADGILWKSRGLWYQIEARKLELDAKRSETPDFIWHGEHYAVVKKRQLNSRELREAGLANEPS